MNGGEQDERIIKIFDERKIEHGLRFEGDLIESIVLHLPIAEKEFTISSKELANDYYAIYVDIISMGGSDTYIYMITWWNNNRKLVKRQDINFDSITNIEVKYS